MKIIEKSLIKLLINILILLVIVNSTGQYFIDGKSSSFNYHTTELSALENMTLIVSETQKVQYIVSASSSTQGQIVIKEIFNSEVREMKINLQNYSTLAIIEILQIHESEFLAILSTNKIIIVNFKELIDDYADNSTGVTYNSPLTFQTFDVSAGQLSSPTALLTDEVDQVYYFSFYKHGGYEVHQFQLVEDINTGYRQINNVSAVSNSATNSILNPYCMSMFTYDNRQFIAFGLATGRIVIYSIFLEQDILTFQAYTDPTNTGKEGIWSIQHIDKTNKIVVQNSEGIVKFYELPAEGTGLLDYQTTGLTLYYQHDNGIQNAQQQHIAVIYNSNYVLFTGLDAKIIIYDVENKVPIVLLDDSTSVSTSLFVARSASYIKGTGYVVLKEFDTNVTNFQNRYALFPICEINFVLSQNFEGCTEANIDDDQDINKETLISVNCGSNGYFDSFDLQCKLCPDTCTVCSSNTFYDFGQNAEKLCKQCNLQGECICRQDKECSSTFFDTDINVCDCSPEQCQLSQDDCTGTEIFDITTCACINNINNEQGGGGNELPDLPNNTVCTNISLCSSCSTSAPDICITCNDSNKTPPDCLCDKGTFWSDDQQKCSDCQNANCLVCQGVKGEDCVIYNDELSREKQSVSYPLQIIIGIIALYTVSAGGVFALKTFKNQKLNKKTKRIDKNNLKFNKVQPIEDQEPEKLSSVGKTSTKSNDFLIQSENSSNPVMNNNSNFQNHAHIKNKNSGMDRFLNQHEIKEEENLNSEGIVD